jgi:hypothetical protein
VPYLHAVFTLPGPIADTAYQNWIACPLGFFLSVRVLSRLFRRLYLQRLTAAYHAGRLEFFTEQAALAPSRQPSSLACRTAEGRMRGLGHAAF